jgi:alanyl-tRNA synthetase
MAQRAEDAANAVIFADTPIVAYEVGDADLSAIPLRKPPKVTGRIRIVEVKGYDWSACGGTHVARTGDFRCGSRALRDYRRASAITAQLAELLSAGPMELPGAITRLKDEAAAQRKALQEAQDKLLIYEAKDLAEAAPAHGNARVVARAWAGRDAAHIRALAKAITSQPGRMALLAGVGEKTALVFARSGNLAQDMRPLLQDVLAKLQEPGKPAPRGGGSADLAQGGLAGGDLAQIEAALIETANGIALA